MDSDAFRRARHARRERRQREIYTHIREAVADISDGFAGRHAWGQDSSSQRISGHPGACASLYVAEVLGEYQIPGTRRCHYLGMQRQAGEHGSGITNGTIQVLAKLTIGPGATVELEIPVEVRAGSMLRPGVGRYQGQPFVMSQSALDDIVDSVAISEGPVGDRKHIFSFPK